MKRKYLFIIAFLCVLAAILLPEVQHLLSLDVHSPMATVLAAGPAFAPLKWNVGQNNMGGYKSRLLFIPAEAVSEVPTVPDPSEATDNNGLVTADGAFTFVESSTVKQPVYLYSTDGTVEYKAEQQGEADGISFKPTLSFFFPGNTPEMHAFNAMIKNTAGYYIFEDVDGRQMILGQPGLPASTTPSFNGGKARADRRGTTYTATADSNYSAIFLKTPLNMEVIGGYKPAPDPTE